MNNAIDVWMHDTINDCCDKHFKYKFDECVGTTGAAVPSTTPGSTNWYPDWEGSEDVCKNE